MTLFSMDNGHRGGLAPSSRNKFVLLVVMNYFTKWVEGRTASPNQRSGYNQVHFKIILSRVNIPRAFISDNGMQFVGQKVKKMLDELRIEFYNSTLSYQQCNRQAESTNKKIMNIIKKRLKKVKGKWVEKLPNVL